MACGGEQVACRERDNKFFIHELGSNFVASTASLVRHVPNVSSPKGPDAPSGNTCPRRRVNVSKSGRNPSGSARLTAGRRTHNLRTARKPISFSKTGVASVYVL